LASQRAQTDGATSSGVCCPERLSSMRRIQISAPDPRWERTSAIDHSVG